MSAWSHLPNATHIDQVLADLKSHPEEFVVAWDASCITARDVASSAAWVAIQIEAWDTVVDAAIGFSRRDEAWLVARAAMIALVAWDRSSNYLTMTHDELSMWYQLTEHPAAMLLLPYAKSQELISQKIGN
jgi:hypothetical protein